MSNHVQQDAIQDITGDLVVVAEVLDRASVPLGLLGLDGVVHYSNASFARAAGRPAGELLGAVLANSVVADDRLRLQSALTGLSEPHGDVADGSAREVTKTKGDTDTPATPHTPVTDVRFVGADGRVRATRLTFGLLSREITTVPADTMDANPTELVLCIVTDRSQERRSERGNRRSRVAEAISTVTDPATGLLNARGLELTLESAARRAERNDSVFALVQCVPRAGESTHDGEDARPDDPVTPEELLVACVERMRQRLRPSDTVARCDDSIMVVAEDLGDEQDAAGVTYRVLSTVVEAVPTDSGPVMVQMHAGIVVADGSTPLHKLAPAAAAAAGSAPSGGFEIVDMRR